MVEDRIEEARARMTRLAKGMTTIFQPMEVAGLLAGAAFEVISAVYGVSTARRYFAEMADEIEKEALQ